MCGRCSGCILVMAMLVMRPLRLETVSEETRGDFVLDLCFSWSVLASPPTQQLPLGQSFHSVGQLPFRTFAALVTYAFRHLHHLHLLPCRHTLPGLRPLLPTPADSDPQDSPASLPHHEFQASVKYTFRSLWRLTFQTPDTVSTEQSSAFVE